MPKSGTTIFSPLDDGNCWIIVDGFILPILQGSLFDNPARESPGQREAASKVYQDYEG